MFYGGYKHVGMRYGVPEALYTVMFKIGQHVKYLTWYSEWHWSVSKNTYWLCFNPSYPNPQSSCTSRPWEGKLSNLKFWQFEIMQIWDTMMALFTQVCVIRISPNCFDFKVAEANFGHFASNLLQVSKLQAALSRNRKFKDWLFSPPRGLYSYIPTCWSIVMCINETMIRHSFAHA